MAVKPAPNTWIVVADGAQAKIFLSDKLGRLARKTPLASFGTTRAKARDLVTDKPGRVFQSVGSRRSAAEMPTDPRRNVEQKFIKDIAARLEKGAKAGAFERLVLVAAPRALGDLRGEFSNPVKRMVVAEVSRDLVNHPPEDVEKHVTKALRP